MQRQAASNKKFVLRRQFAVVNVVAIVIVGVQLLSTSNLNAQTDSPTSFLPVHSARPPRAQFSRNVAEVQRDDARRSLRMERWRGLLVSPLEDPGTIGDLGSSSISVTHIDYLEEREALPIASSQMIAIGRVLGSQSFVTPDKTSVYSEFSIAIDHVLKRAGAGIQPTIVGVRGGGEVSFPSGHSRTVLFEGIGYPKQGPTYLFFLRQQPNSEDFGILTAYELTGSEVYALDDSEPFLAFDHLKQRTFLRIVSAQITDIQNGGRQ